MTKIRTRQEFKSDVLAWYVPENWESWSPASCIPEALSTIRKSQLINVSNELMKLTEGLNS